MRFWIPRNQPAVLLCDVIYSTQARQTQFIYRGALQISHTSAVKKTSASESSSRNSDNKTGLYSDIVCLDGVENEVLERDIETDPRGNVCL